MSEPIAGKRKRGRPPMPETERHDARRTIQLRAQEDDELCRMAMHRGVSVAEVAREAILAHIDRRKQTPTA